jgi:hypothetical protein
MNACLIIFTGCIVGFLAPAIASAQDDYHPAIYVYNEGGSAITSNVPLNEINTHAYRHFQRLFPSGTSGEYWFVSPDGYQVSFLRAGHHYRAFFDKHGAYRYSLCYYPGKEIPRNPGDLIKARYPDYRIDVVTEITDGEKTFHLVKILNVQSIKTLSVSDGRIEVLEQLINDAPTASPTTSPTASLSLLSSYP